MMNTSMLSFTLVRSPKTKFSDAQFLLEEFTGKRYSRSESETIWADVVNHKWNISERLGRDVGLRVAAIDFTENFYQPGHALNQTRKSFVTNIKIPSVLIKILRTYFELKGNSTHL